MAVELTAPVPLSTPDDHVFAEVEGVGTSQRAAPISDEEIEIRYEIRRTVEEIRRNRWRRVALQFPDEMLRDSARVYRLLSRELRDEAQERKGRAGVTNEAEGAMNAGQGENEKLHSEHGAQMSSSKQNVEEVHTGSTVKLTILGDTSYGSCCVDEVAAEHVDADAVVHYGRTCLSPVSRLPIIYVLTKHHLSVDTVNKAFRSLFPDQSAKVIVMADTPYTDHVDTICSTLKSDHGYQNVFATETVRDAASLIPNRTLPDEVTNSAVEGAKQSMKDWTVFHISDPPTALLLTLESRVKSVHIFPTTSSGDLAAAGTTQVNTAQILRRRYALVTSLSTVSTWGILINTLSVKNYLHIVDHVKEQIAAAGKKSYLFVVGKLNPAKVANFAEIGGWVVIGCWESSLVDSRDFYRPIVTPFELELALQSDSERVWTGEWQGDFQAVLDHAKHDGSQDTAEFTMPGAFIDEQAEDEDDPQEFDSDEESAPPEFDLRTGRYVSRTRPMRNGTAARAATARSVADAPSTALARRANGDVLAIRGIASPAAEYLAEKRTWRGLGSDFELRYEDEEVGGSLIEEGRTGVARGYTTGDSSKA